MKGWIPKEVRIVLGALAVLTKVLLELLDAHANGGDTSKVAHDWRSTVQAHHDTVKAAITGEEE